MYKIKVRNERTGKVWWEYGFSRQMMKRLAFLFNNTNLYTYENTYTVLEVIHIVCNLSTLKKCFTNHCELVN